MPAYLIRNKVKCNQNKKDNKHTTLQLGVAKYI